MSEVIQINDLMSITSIKMIESENDWLIERPSFIFQHGFEGSKAPVRF